MGPTLPQETLEEIIDFLYNDRKSLLACSLASPKFVPVSRYHLFSSTTITAAKICTLLNLLDAPWCSISNIISRLVVAGSGPPIWQLNPQWVKRSCGQARVQYIPRNFGTLLQRLQSVVAVSLANISSIDVPETFWRLLSEMKNIKAMEAHRIAFDGCPLPFFGYISSLPLLESFSISWPTMTLNATALAALQERIVGEEGEKVQLVGSGAGSGFRLPVLDIRRAVQIPGTDRDLRASTVAGIAILEWLLVQKMIPSVGLLRMNLDYEPGLVEVLSRYFETAGSRVEKLFVVLPSSVSALQDMVPIDFSQLTRLRSLHIDGFFTSHGSNGDSLEDFFRGFLAQLFSSSHSSAATIQRISIALTIDMTEDYSFYGVPEYAVLQQFTWCSLPSILEKVLGPCSEALETIEVQLRVRSPGTAANHTSFVEQTLRRGVWKQFSERGCLRIVFLSGHERDEESSWM
ncbi:hypothetical protein CVT26_010189 [Gymnopilus dilepis]|uniref:F-box domain-containing protein n=1 Tax=Gymnopilus dilepis TaxID=231916 RepID=A0A409WD34_9AGAR|nr:hypothetical protein CVT26_010189 [Gymnopilus dilepis]